MKYEFPLLDKEQISVKVKQVTASGAIALLYKSARVDMDMLDDVVSPENWTCDYREIHGNLYCGIAIKSDNGEWVWKWDCGIESAQDDGNEKKAEASDAFKRAGFRWGIGRELYTSPFIFLNVETEQRGSGYKLKNAFDRFEVSAIRYDDRRKIEQLTIVNSKTGAVVFNWEFGHGNKSAPRKAESKMPVPTPAHSNEWHVGDTEMAELKNKLTPEQMQKCFKAFGENLFGMSKVTYEKALAKAG